MPSAPLFAALVRCALIASVLVMLGLAARLATLTVVLLHGYLFACDVLLFRNHVLLALLLGSLLALSPGGQVVSLDAVLRRRLGRPWPREGSLLVARTIAAQVWLVYAWAALNKLRPSFLSGWVLAEELPYPLHEGALARLWVAPDGRLLPALARWLGDAHAQAGFAWLVMLTEVLLAAGLLVPRTRRAACALGLALHLGIFAALGVLTFGLLMVSSYPLFLFAWGTQQGPSRQAQAGLHEAAQGIEG